MAAHSLFPLFVLRRVVGATVACVWLAACGADDSTCEQRGGVRVRGVCVCPEDKPLEGNRCEGSFSAPASGDTPDAPEAADAEVDTTVPTTSARDGGLGGARPTLASDASARALPSDAGSQRDGAAPASSAAPDAALGSPPPSPPPAPSDGDAGAPCMPMGDWTVTRTISGNCAATSSVFVTTFHGDLIDPYVSDTGCLTLWDRADDGCSLTYTQDCSLPAGRTERDVGTVSLSSTTTMTGSSTVTDFEAGQSGSPECSATATLTAHKN